MARRAAAAYRRLGEDATPDAGPAGLTEVPFTMGRWSYFTPIVRYYSGSTASGPPELRYASMPPVIHYYHGDKTHVYIGNFCSIANEVEFMPGANHRVDWVSTYPFREFLELPGAYEGGVVSKGDIVIGSDVWIGRGAKILSGVTVGAGSVIGAYAVVAKDVRPYAIVVGNPAREVRRRFSDQIIDRLLRIGWWDWTDDELTARALDLSDTDVEKFVETYG